MKNIVILISGRGSNMEALIAARDAGNLTVNIAAVISNRPDAAGLETAAKGGDFSSLFMHLDSLEEALQQFVAVVGTLEGL